MILAQLEQEVRAFLVENFPLGEDARELPVDRSLVDAGLLDSTGVLELVDFIESRFAIGIDDEDLLPENFDSIERIVSYVGRQTSGENLVP